MPSNLLEKMHRFRDRVLENASISSGQVVLDVGCGDGLIGFGALDRAGPHGRVIFSDVSSELVGGCRVTAQRRGVLDRCQFVVAPATDLGQIADRSVDVVTTRSVLIYVDDKPSALGEFFRVLRPGGRLSIGEPINQFTYPEPRGVFLGYDVSPVRELADKLEAFFDQEERPKIASMMDFNERDLLAMTERAGFSSIHLTFEADVRPVEPEDWDRFMNTAGNPLSPTMAQAIDATMTVAERDRFTAYLRPLVESGDGIERRAFAYLFATKPR